MISLSIWWKTKLQDRVDSYIRTFALSFENQTYTFKMEYEYDSWNRMQTMTYPDGEAAGRGYTKHYYAETERICSKIGGGGLAELGEGDESGPAKPHLDNAYDLLLSIKSCLGSVPQTNPAKNGRYPPTQNGDIRSLFLTRLS